MPMAAFIRHFAAALLLVSALGAAAQQNSGYADLTDPPFRIGDILAAPEGPRDASRPFVRLLVTQFTYPNQNIAIIRPTIEAFRKLFGRGNFEARVYSGTVVDPSSAEFFLSSAGTFMRAVPQGARSIVTVASDLRPNPNEGEGSLFVVLKSRTDLQHLNDLKSKRVAVDSFFAFSGFHTALGEIFERDEDPDHFFSSAEACGHDMRCTLDQLRQGRADVAILRTCFLEEFGALGGKVGDLRPVAVRPESRQTACLSSTRLYPNWTLFTSPDTDPETVRKAAAALLALPAQEGGLRWSIASDFSSADTLYRNLKLGPYAYLRSWSLARFWAQYRLWIVLAATLTLGLAFHSYLAARLVKKRTAQLRRALYEQRATEQRARKAQSRIEALERMGAIGQISSIVAHELRQPLSTIVAYAHGMHRLLEKPDARTNSLIEKGIEKIERQAERADYIVERVRAYAKTKHAERRSLDAAEIMAQAAQMMNESKAFRHQVRYEPPSERFLIFADAFQIELCILNLLKNALQAVEAQDAADVCLRAAPATERLQILVEDNGPTLSDEAFEKLQQPLQSEKVDGLGLGLSIVRVIAESHGGRLFFERRNSGGLRAVLSLPYDAGAAAPREEAIEEKEARHGA